jgi:hypothetical protein
MGSANFPVAWPGRESVPAMARQPWQVARPSGRRRRRGARVAAPRARVGSPKSSGGGGGFDGSRDGGAGALRWPVGDGSCIGSDEAVRARGGKANGEEREGELIGVTCVWGETGGDGSSMLAKKYRR